MIIASILYVILFADSGYAMIITVNDDGDADFQKIQDAIYYANDGDTIRVFDGTYNESVIVNKALSLVGNGSEKTTINGSSHENVVDITANWVIMSGFKITLSKWILGTYGIKIESNNNTIQNNYFINNYIGIYLKNSNNNTLTNNTCENNYIGICLGNSNNNMLMNNTCDNKHQGIYLGNSNNNTITNNTCEYNRFGIYLHSSSNSTVANNTCTYNYHGIELWKSNDCVLPNNNCSNNQGFGISFILSSNNIVVNNTIFNNEIGIFLKDDSKNNKAHYSQIFNNRVNGINTTENGGYKIVATANWWGDTSGPYQIDVNRMGKGNSISGPISFYPWKDAQGNVREDFKPQNESVDDSDNSILFILLIILSFLFISLYGVIRIDNS